MSSFKPSHSFSGKSPSSGRPKDRVVDVTIVADGQEKRLFTVREKTKDDLIVVLKRGALAGGTPRSGRADDGVPSLIKQSRYTIHPSNASPTGNLINYHYDGKHRETFNGRFWTDAIKLHDGFAPVTQVWVPDVRSPTFDPSARKAPERVSLGIYEPDHFRLRYMVLISAPGRAFAMPKGENINETSIVFRRFRLTILWNYVPFPSDAQGQHLGWESVRDADTMGVEYWTEDFQVLAYDYFAQEGVRRLLQPIYAGHVWLNRSSRHGRLKPYVGALKLHQIGKGPLFDNG